MSGNLTNPWSLFGTVNSNIYVDNGEINNRIDLLMSNATSSKPVINVNASCTGLFTADNGTTLYCSMASNHLILKIELNNSVLTPVIAAGTGCRGPVSDTLDHPHGIFVDHNSYLYVADAGNNRIQRFAPGQSKGVTLAGFGAKVHFMLNRPTSIVLDADGYLFIVESLNHRIVRSIPDGFQCIIGCSNNNGMTSSQLNNPQTMAFDSLGNIFVTDMDNHRIQKFTLVINNTQFSITTELMTTVTVDIGIYLFIFLKGLFNRS